MSPSCPTSRAACCPDSEMRGTAPRRHITPLFLRWSLRQGRRGSQGIELENSGEGVGGALERGTVGPKAFTPGTPAGLVGKRRHLGCLIGIGSLNGQRPWIWPLAFSDQGGQGSDSGVVAGWAWRCSSSTGSPLTPTRWSSASLQILDKRATKTDVARQMKRWKVHASEATDAETDRHSGAQRSPPARPPRPVASSFQRRTIRHLVDASRLSKSPFRSR